MRRGSDDRAGAGKPVFLLATADVADGRQVKGTQDVVPQIPDFLKDRQFISLFSETEERAHQRLLHGLEKQGLKKQDFQASRSPLSRP